MVEWGIVVHPGPDVHVTEEIATDVVDISQGLVESLGVFLPDPASNSLLSSSFAHRLSLQGVLVV
jgi:hypothetical protein